MSGLLMPAAARMSTISVETTARLTICWIANSRSCCVTPEPVLLLTNAARIAWKKPTSSRMSRASSEADAKANALESASTASWYRRWALFLPSSVFSFSASFCCRSRIHSMAPAIMASRSCGVPLIAET
ncbi:hypothetical protein D9M68_920340 [compost metagenome]